MKEKIIDIYLVQILIVKKLKQGVELWLRNNSDETIQNYIELKSEKIQLNHKVVKIEWLKETQDCCDLEIEKYHNFALSAGVFVHNCDIGCGMCAVKTSLTEISVHTIKKILGGSKDYHGGIRSCIPVGFSHHY